MSLITKYRPKTLEDLLGNSNVKAALSPIIEGKKSLPHAVILSGPSGCGKTTIARILAESVGAQAMDIAEKDIGDFRGIDSVREIREQVAFRPIGGKSRVWILDEAQAFTKDAQGALLKILEEPPNFVYFILCTTEPQQLSTAIRNRCSHFQVGEITEGQINKLVDRVLKGENKTLSFETIQSILRIADGVPRMALSALDSIIDSEAEGFLLVEEREAQIKELCQALLKSGETWKNISSILKGIKAEPESIRRAVLGYMNAVLLNGGSSRAALIIECFKDNYFSSGGAGLTASCYKVLSLR